MQLNELHAFCVYGTSYSAHILPMATLFDVGVPVISKHLKNIFESGELQKEVVVSKMEIPAKHGAIEGKVQTSQVEFYNLDAIISVEL